MNGAQALIRTLVDCGVDVCFTNPGTSEMHFVAALDHVPEMRGILATFEGVATGAAEGYGRMAGKPASVLLHLGPGFGNGLANLHNARKGRVPVVNIVGDHASYHKQYDAQLESDIETVARNVSADWTRVCTDPARIGSDAAAAVAASTGPPGRVATLILPADVSWLDGGMIGTPQAAEPPSPVDAGTVEQIASALRSGSRSALFVGGAALSMDGLVAASRVANATGAKLLGETFPRRLERGAGIPALERLGYLAEFAAMQLDGVQNLVLVDAKAPVSFFAYPGKESYLVPDGCEVQVLATGADDVVGALAALADAVGAPPDGATLAEPSRPARPDGDLTARSVGDALGALLPEGAVLVDEAITSGIFLGTPTAGCPPHTFLSCPIGGSIGEGLPVAVGAAVAAPDRKIVSLQADGSALYTIQALWSMARENLDVTVVLFNNGAYDVLNMELNRVGAEPPGPKAKKMLDLTGPVTNFTKISEGFGVPATRASTAAELTIQLEVALETPGPTLVEAMIPGIV